MTKKEQRQNSDSFFEDLSNNSSVVSNMDCTGLIPTLASDGEVEAYADLTKIPKPDDQYIEE